MQVGILVFLLLIIQSYRAQVTIQQIPFCLTTHVLTTESSQPFNPQIICIECKKLKVLSSDFMECLDVRQELGLINLGNCLRLGEDGNCAEALLAIELNNSKYSYIEEIMYNERCAQIDLGYSRCLYPRFGYTLDIATRKIRYDNSYFHSYCAIYDSRKKRCVEYFPGFLPNREQGLGRYLKNFINKSKIDSLKSNSSFIACKDGYIFVGTQKDPIGCIPFTKRVQKKEPILNCQEHEQDNILCNKCKPGFAINKNRLFCKNLKFDKCIEYQTILGEEICTRCELFYRYLNGKCQQMNNCKELSKYNHRYCVACESPYYIQLETNSCVLQKDEPNQLCSQFASSHECQLCKENEKYYSIKYQCQERKNFNCKNFHPFKDSCSSLECADDTFYIQFDSHKLNIDITSPNLGEMLKETLFKEKDNLKDIFNIYCQKRESYPIDGCLKYNPFLDSCQECDTGFFLKLDKVQEVNSEHEKQNPNKHHNKKINYICSDNNPQYNLLNIIIDNCLQYSIDKQSCLQCESGFVQSQNKCIKGIQNCKVHFDEKTCWQCDEGYIDFGYLIKEGYDLENPCRKNEKLIGLIPHITQKDQIQVYNFDINKCIQYNNQNNCSECFQGYFLTQSFLCISDEILPDCKIGEVIQKNEYMCKVCTKQTTLVHGRCEKQFSYSCIDKNCPKKCNSIFKLKPKSTFGFNNGMSTNTNQNNSNNTTGGKNDNKGGTSTKPKNNSNTTTKNNNPKNNNTKNNNNSKNDKNNKQNQNNIEQPENKCEVNIEDMYFINEQPKYNKSLLGQLEIKQCKYTSCVRCENNGCIKCEKSYALDNNKQCQRICEGKSTDNEFCVKVDQNEDYDESDDQDFIIVREQVNDKSNDFPNEDYDEVEENTDNENKQNIENNDKFTSFMIVIIISISLIILILLLAFRYVRRRALKKNTSHIPLGNETSPSGMNMSYTLDSKDLQQSL